MMPKVSISNIDLEPNEEITIRHWKNSKEYSEVKVSVTENNKFEITVDNKKVK